MSVGIHHHFLDTEMPCDGLEGIQAFVEFLLCIQIGIGEVECAGAFFLKEPFHACGGAGAAATMEQQRRLIPLKV